MIYFRLSHKTNIFSQFFTFWVRLTIFFVLNPDWVRVPVVRKMILLTFKHFVLKNGASTGLSDEERVNFVRPKTNSLFKKPEKNDTKNRNGQI